jgi:ABC-type amino acid transport substrate-binding protein
MRLFRLLIFTFFICSCSWESKDVLRVGVDKNWYPVDFGPQVSYVNGFVEELLLDLSRYSGMQFQLIYTNWSSLFEGMKKDQYDAVFSTVSPQDYNKDEYEFSVNLFDIGPVLIVDKNSTRKSLAEMKGELVGIIINDPAENLVAKYPTVIIRKYKSIPELLNAIVDQEIEAAVLNRIPAVNFVEDLYASTLKIVGEPLTDAGIRLVSHKGKGDRFNRNLETFKQRKTYKDLLRKWSL